VTPQPLYQADGRWSGNVLGHGPGSVGRYGCLELVLTMAARILETRPALLPPAANRAFLEADAFQHWEPKTGAIIRADRLVPALAAPAIGLEAPNSDALKSVPCDPHLIDVIKAALSGGLAILHVDHDGGRPGGDEEPDHFVLAYTATPNWDRVLCLDPAVGRVQIGIPSLESLGEVVWGAKDRRKYRVAGVRAVRRAPQ
jgi:hypothetical protein